MFIDLEATRGDHDEVRSLVSHDPPHLVLISRYSQTGNEKDVTMQAGKQRGALPLIRKFNEHSERLLKSAVCAILASTTRPGSKDVPIDPRKAPASGGKWIQGMLMMYAVLRISTLTSSHSVHPVQSSQDYYSQIDLADLHNPESSAGILLEMQDRQRYFEARPGAAPSAEQAPRPVRSCRLFSWSRHNRGTTDRLLTCCAATNET